MLRLSQCRTAALGGHVEQCDHCGHRRVWYKLLSQPPLSDLSVAVLVAAPGARPRQQRGGPLKLALRCQPAGERRVQRGGDLVDVPATTPPTSPPPAQASTPRVPNASPTTPTAPLATSTHALETLTACPAGRLPSRFRSLASAVIALTSQVFALAAEVDDLRNDVRQDIADAIEAFEQATIEAIEAAGRIQAGAGGSSTVDPPDDDRGRP